MKKDIKAQRLVESHLKYEKFYLIQRIIELELGDSITISTKDSTGAILEEETFIAKEINCHFNFTFQDKGMKSDDNLFEYKLVRKGE